MVSPDLIYLSKVLYFNPAGFTSEVPCNGSIIGQSGNEVWVYFDNYTLNQERIIVFLNVYLPNGNVWTDTRTILVNAGRSNRASFVDVPIGDAETFGGIAGAGYTNECRFKILSPSSTPPPPPPPPRTRLACLNRVCTRVGGTGLDECSRESYGCDPPPPPPPPPPNGRPLPPPPGGSPTGGVTCLLDCASDKACYAYYISVPESDQIGGHIEAQTLIGSVCLTQTERTQLETLIGMVGGTITLVPSWLIMTATVAAAIPIALALNAAKQP